MFHLTNERVRLNYPAMLRPRCLPQQSRDPLSMEKPRRSLPRMPLLFWLGLVWIAVLPTALALEVGDRVQANQNVNVRNAPAGSLIGTRTATDLGTIVGGPVTADLSTTTYVWWQVNWDTGIDGWCFEGGISLMPEVDPDLLYGIDVSHYQGTITWTSVASAGKTFAFCKSTEGVSSVDDTFANNMTKGRSAGLRMGAYHFARPNSNAAVDEARFFVKTATPYLLAGNMLPVLDLESGLELGKADLSQWTRDWCQEVERLTTLRPIVYTSRNYARNYAETDLKSWPLWIAEPESAPGTPTSGIGPWAKWTFKQYSWTGRVPGIGGGAADVDLDSFAGTPQDLAVWQIPVITHTFTSAAPSTATAAQGTTITLNATIQSTVGRRLLLGASLFPPNATTGGISDAAHDGLVTLTPGAASVSRFFTLPSSLAPGQYDLWLALYNDINDNGIIDAEDAAVGTTYKKQKALTVTPPASFQTWTAEQGLSGAAASPIADADGDGADNLMEYAFGTQPKSATSLPLTTLALLPAATGETASRLSFTFPRAANRPDLTWSAEISADLKHWTAVGTVSGDTPFTGPGWSLQPGDPALVSLRIYPYAAGPTFLRVKVVKN